MDKVKEPNKPKGYWKIKENCRLEALKYPKSSDFAKFSRTAYNYSNKNKWLTEFYSHEYVLYGHWNLKENCIEESKKYRTRGEFGRNAYGAYESARRNNWLDELYPKNAKLKKLRDNES